MNTEYKYSDNLKCKTAFQKLAMDDDRLLKKYVRKYFREVFNTTVTLILLGYLGQDRKTIETIELNIWYKNALTARTYDKILGDLGIKQQNSYGVSKRYISNENIIKLLDIIEAKYHDIIYTKEVPHEYL